MVELFLENLLSIHGVDMLNLNLMNLIFHLVDFSQKQKKKYGQNIYLLENK